MATRILSAALVACLAGFAAAAPASADSTYESNCSRDKWSKVYKCWSEYDSPYSHSTTDCYGGHCDTRTESKPQPKIVIPEPPRPYTPPTAVRDPYTGVEVMRGMSR